MTYQHNYIHIHSHTYLSIYMYIFIKNILLLMIIYRRVYVCVISVDTNIYTHIYTYTCATTHVKYIGKFMHLSYTICTHVEDMDEIRRALAQGVLDPEQVG